MDCICAAVSKGLPNHCILVTSGGPSSLPIIISSIFKFQFLSWKILLSVFSLIFIIFHLDSKLLLWQRKATQVLVAAVLIPQSLNWWLQCLSCSSQSFNDEIRECSSPWFLLIMLAALPEELGTSWFPPVATGEVGSTIRSQECWLRGSIQNMRTASKKRSWGVRGGEVFLTEVFHPSSPSY